MWRIVYFFVGWLFCVFFFASQLWFNRMAISSGVKSRLIVLDEAIFREERRLLDDRIGWVVVVEFIVEDTEGWSTDSIEPSEGLVRRARRLRIKVWVFCNYWKINFDENFNDFHQSQSKKLLNWAQIIELLAPCLTKWCDTLNFQCSLKIKKSKWLEIFSEMIENLCNLQTKKKWICYLAREWCITSDAP